MAEASKHELEEGTQPSVNPPSGFRSFYPKTDGWYSADSSGIETKFSTAADIVEDAINDGEVNKAPTENAVYDALATRDAAIAGKQDQDDGLDNLAAFNTNGFVVQNANDSFVGRQLQEGAGISITNPDGVSGDPVIASTITQYTDELAQDAIGSALTDTSTIDLEYNDSLNQITADLKDNAVSTNKIQNSAVDDSKVASGINATKIGGGAVDNTEFGYLNGVTSAIQTQLDAKALAAININTASNSGLSGGGDLSADRSLAVDITNLPAMTNPTTRVDYTDLLAVYDNSATNHKKITLKDFTAQRRSLIDRAYTKADDFECDSLGALTATGAGTGNSTQQGTYGMDNIENALGISQSDTGTTATGRRIVGCSGLNQLTTGLARYRIAVRFALEQLSNGTDTFQVTLGFINNTGAGDHTGGAYFRYSHGVNSGKWEAVTANGTGSPTRTAVDTGVTADTLYSIFEVEIAEDSSSAKYYINGSLVATITTNLPPQGTATNQTFAYGWKIEKSVGTTQCNISADWYVYEQERTNAR